VVLAIEAAQVVVAAVLPSTRLLRRARQADFRASVAAERRHVVSAIVGLRAAPLRAAADLVVACVQAGAAVAHVRPVEEAARVLQSHPFGCLPVVDDGALVGIITESDILRALAELMGPGGITSRMEVLMPNRPGELARVIRVIGIEMRINIAGIFAPVVGEQCHAVMHLQTASAAPVVEALRKMGYVCGSPAIELDGAQLPPPRRQRPAFQL
jgi:CBS domain-containing protein